MLKLCSFDARSRTDHGCHTKKREQASLEGSFIEHCAIDFAVGSDPDTFAAEHRLKLNS